MKLNLLLGALLLTINIQAQWVQISSGTEFTLALKSDGTLWTWGFNGNGQLGLGLPLGEIVSEPTQIGTDNDWHTIVAGAVHALAIKKDRTLWAWGGNGVNQLGDGASVDRNAPVLISEDTDWDKIFAGQAHNIAIKTDGTLWAWGFNAFGQVGNGLTGNVSIPVMVSSDTDWETASCGGAHSLALRNNGHLYAWGANFNGQLGSGDNSPLLMPTMVNTNVWKSISCGFEFSVAIQEDSTLWTWGFNGNGQLGNGGTADRNTPGQIGIALGGIWDNISAGPAYCLAISNDGSLYGWGINISGCLGLGDMGPSVLTPTLIDSQDTWVIAVAPKGLASGGSVFGFHSMAVKSARDVICVAGANYISQLGTGDQLNRTEFECIVGQLMVSVNQLESPLDFAVYPNPAVDFINLFGPENQSYKVYVFSLDGKLMHQDEHFTKNKQYYIGHFPPGIYQISISDNNNFTNIKFIKGN